MQITKAMELVASSKLRKAKEKADKARPYFDALYRRKIPASFLPLPARWGRASHFW